jgi:hypothetical protein
MVGQFPANHLDGDAPNRTVIACEYAVLTTE